ncbi:MAG TPA: TM2 domain-containing protein [Hyphomicrobiaceae bacterium]|jgi:hypothetical protein
MTATDPVRARSLLIEPELLDKLPQVVKSELAKLPPERQAEFAEEFKRKLASTPAAYLCSLLFCHYGYLGRWGMTIIMWIASIVTFGIVGLIWWLIDLFRIPRMVANYNKDVAVAVMRDLKIIHGS